MRTLVSLGLVLAAAVAVALPAAATGAPASATAPARAAANTATYQDSIGENPAAPDITTIVVLVSFATTTLVDEPGTAIALVVILILAVILDLVWKGRRTQPAATA